MSRVLIDNGRVVVSRHVGPAAEGDDRARWQLYVADGMIGIATLSRDEVLALAHALIRDAAPAAEGAE